MRRALPVLLVLAACGRVDDDAAPGGVTHDQARQLNEAAAATDINATQPDNEDTQP